MATIGSALATVKCKLSEYVPESVVREICLELGYHWRERVLGPLTTIRLLLLQLLAGVGLIRLHHVAQVVASAAAICKAKQRLPLKVLASLVARLGGGATPAELPLWKHRHRLVLADATTFLTEDTAELARTYGKAKNQRTPARPGYPVVKVLALMDLASGLIQKVIGIPHARHEQTVLSRLFALLKAGDLLLGDRGLVSFAHVALMPNAAVDGCLRLPRTLVVFGRGKGQRHRQARLGRQDLLVRWDRPLRHTLSWLSYRRWSQLPMTLTLRQIVFRLRRPGFRTQWAWGVTTLTCPITYPAQEIAELYGRRWQIEVNFRDLKQSLRMRKFSARSVDGVRKEILAFVLLHNLVRLVMAEAARRQGVPPDRIGFRDAMTWLLWSEVGDPLPELQVNRRRIRPTEPRARKHGGYLFPILQRPRVVLQLPAAEALI
jgi:hypothetical protein